MSDIKSMTCESPSDNKKTTSYIAVCLAERENHGENVRGCSGKRKPRVRLSWVDGFHGSQELPSLNIIGHVGGEKVNSLTWNCSEHTDGDLSSLCHLPSQQQNDKIHIKL